MRKFRIKVHYNHYIKARMYTIETRSNFGFWRKYMEKDEFCIPFEWAGESIRDARAKVFQLRNSEKKRVSWSVESIID